MDDKNKCDCDFEHPVVKGRATWLCPKCGRDYSLEYLFYWEATHPNLGKDLTKFSK